MGSWRKMGAFLGLVPEDEHADGEYQHADGDYGYEPGYSPENPYPGSEYPPAGARYGDELSAAGVTRGRGRSHPDSGGMGEQGPQTQGALAMQPRLEPRTAVRAGSDSATAARPVTVKLSGFGEARIIGERYRDGGSVILDMTDLSDADARRVVDFAAGLAFALRGSIDKVTTKVFMLLPPHADLSAEDRRAFAGSYSAR